MAPPLQKYRFTSASVQVCASAGALRFERASCQAIRPGGGGASLSSLVPLESSVAWHLMLNSSSPVMRGQREAAQERGILFWRGLRASVCKTLAGTGSGQTQRLHGHINQLLSKETPTYHRFSAEWCTDTMPSDTDTTVGLVLLNVVLYAFAYQLQRPVEPFLIKSLSDGDAKTVAKTYGRLQSFFQAAQTIGSFIVGALLDKIGARYCSVIVFLASASSYAILASSTTLSHLFLSKLAATLQAGFLVAQAGVAAATATAPPAVRAAALGRLTTAYTIGATVGPTVGGYLGATGDLYRGARLAVGVSICVEIN